MKKSGRYILAILFISLNIISSNSQNWKYSSIVKSDNNVSPNAMGIDGLGNIYILGTFKGDIGFGSGAVTPDLTSSQRVAFLAKYNSNGDTLWVHRIGDANKVRGKGLAVDGSANIYITGSVAGSSEFESNVTSSVTLNNYIGEDILGVLNGSVNSI